MNIAMVAANTFKWVSWGKITVYEIFGYNAQGATVYIQLHQTPPISTSAAPANGTVPVVKSLLCATAAAFKFSFPNGIELSELTVCCSSTEPNLTIVGANGGLDMTLNVDCDNLYLIDGTEVITGDLTTGTAAIVPWTNAEGPKRLLRVDTKNNTGSVMYLMAFCNDSATTGDRPDLPLVSIPGDNSLKSFSYGPTGVGPVRVQAGVTYDGMALAYSTTVPGLTLYGATSAVIRSIHKP